MEVRAGIPKGYVRRTGDLDVEVDQFQVSDIFVDRLWRTCSIEQIKGFDHRRCVYSSYVSDDGRIGRDQLVGCYAFRCMLLGVSLINKRTR